MSRTFASLFSIALVALAPLSCSPEADGPLTEQDDDEDEQSMERGAVSEDEPIDAGGDAPDAARAARDAARPRDDARTSADPRADAARDEPASERDAGTNGEAGSPSEGEADADAAAPTSPSDAAVAMGTPSAGCGKGRRPSGGRVSVQGDHNYVFPASYDGERPLPLLIGFHAASNPIEQIENLTKGSAFEQAFVRAFPKSKGSAWDYKTDIGKVRAMYDDLMANHCIDVDRVYATGHSSGAQLIVQILSSGREADAKHLRFRAVAPVAASRYGTVSRIPVLYIQGKSDSERRSNGSDVVAEFTAANGCKATSQPSPLGRSCMSSGRTVRAGCIAYDGCSEPTLWCSHDDPAYANTNHGWPCFATQAMYDFFASLP